MVFINFADSIYSFFKRENGKRVGFRRVKNKQKFTQKLQFNAKNGY